MEPTSRKEFYEYCYPDTCKLAPSSLEQIFNGYGALEAVDVEYIENLSKFCVQAKKQRPLLVDQHNKDLSWILAPSTPVQPLGNPDPINHDINPPVQILSLYKDRLTQNEGESEKQIKPEYNFKQQFQNFNLDHSDIAKPTYDRLIANADDVCLRKTNRVGKGKTLDFDPSTLDIPASLLKELLEEEIREDTKKVIFDESYTGGALSVLPLPSSRFHENGILIHPSSTFDGISLKLFSLPTSYHNQYMETNSIIEPQIIPGAIHKIPLDGCALQTDCVHGHNYKPQYFGVRTYHDVLVASIGDDCVVFDDDENFSSLQFSDTEKIQTVGKLHSELLLSNFSMSPHIEGEAMVATYDQRMFLWDVSQHSDVLIDSKTASNPQLEEIHLSRNTPSSWMQVDFAAHPRQIYLAGRKCLNLLDMRGQSTSSRLLYTPCHDKLPDEMIMCIMSASKFNRSPATSYNEFQCFVATQNHLLIIDQRFCKEPVLKWSLNMRYPCHHMAATTLPSQSGTDTHLHHMLLTANQNAQELHCYQYHSQFGVTKQVTNTRRSNNIVQRPPISVSLPRALDTIKDIRRYLCSYTIPKHRDRIIRRLQQPVIGSSAFSYKLSNGIPGVAVFQVNLYGDITYQLLTLSDPQLVYDNQNIVSGQFTQFSGINKQSSELAIGQIYQTWAEAAQKSIDEIKEPKPANSKIVSQKIDASVFSAYQSLLPNSKCIVCKNTVIRTGSKKVIDDLRLLSSKKINLNRDTTHDHDTDDSDSQDDVEWQSGQTISPKSRTPTFDSNTHCLRCRANLKTSEMLLNAHTSGKVKWIPEEDDPFEYEEQSLDEDFEDLDLIDTSCAKSGVGKILVETWDGSYQDMWDSMNHERMMEEKAAEAERLKEIFDLSEGPKTPQDCGNVKAAQEVNNENTSVWESDNNNVIKKGKNYASSDLFGEMALNASASKNQNKSKEKMNLSFKRTFSETDFSNSVDLSQSRNNQNTTSTPELQSKVTSLDKNVQKFSLFSSLKFFPPKNLSSSFNEPKKSKSNSQVKRKSFTPTVGFL
nr:uncharacterized protein LOC100184347 [Ciona intestinalis]|eukprot:XP_018671119.1 uncharacterized protein LOC100184347 [Ciona intestinalis]